MSDRKSLIEDVATRAVKKDGIRSISFRTLADEVGVKSSSVHYHFPTKADLAQSLVNRYSGEFALKLEEISAKHNTPRDRLLALVDAFNTNLADADLCLCGMMAAELNSLDKKTQQVLDRFFVTAEAWIAAQIEGDIDGLSPAAWAKILISALEGAVMLDRVSQGSERLSACRQLVTKLT